MLGTTGWSWNTSHMNEILEVEGVMVCAQSHSFWRTIKGWLRQSLQLWPPHHCSVPPLPLATLIGIISDLHRISSPTPIPPTNLHSYHCHYQPAPCATLLQHNQSPIMLHTHSMSQANHIAHAPVLEVMGFGCHKDLQGFESASFGTLRSTSLFVICSILQPYALLTISLYVHVLICINNQVVVCILLVWIST